MAGADLREAEQEIANPGRARIVDFPVIQLWATVFVSIVLGPA